MPDRIKVLMVDDEERFCKTTTKLLEPHNIAVTSMTQGERALSEITKNQYDVVLLDIKMPGISGVEILAQIKKMEHPPEVIIISGHASADIALTTTRLDAYDYMIKPCDPEELAVKIFQAYERMRQKSPGR